MSPHPSGPSVHVFPCLEDNYGFLLHEPESGETVSIDTPDAERILAEADRLGWRITQVWNTHWHRDHAGGNARLKAKTGCRIIAPAAEGACIEVADERVREGDIVSAGGLEAVVLETPGHTLGHICYHLPDIGVVFVGDTLFALGCGRLFEGAPAQMWRSLSRLAALPDDTVVYCAHEYTAGNAAFALSVDPRNSRLAAYADRVRDRRSRGEPTVPTTIGAERLANPFLRADDAALQQAMGHPGDPVATFAAVRAAKDVFR